MLANIAASNLSIQPEDNAHRRKRAKKIGLLRPSHGCKAVAQQLLSEILSSPSEEKVKICDPASLSTMAHCPKAVRWYSGFCCGLRSKLTCEMGKCDTAK